MATNYNEMVKNYHNVLRDESFLRLYKRLIDVMNKLRLHLLSDHSYPLHVGTLHIGMHDWSYFSSTSEKLKKHKLKTILLLNHKDMKFEAWLVGGNKVELQKWWNRFKADNQTSYTITESPVESIFEETLLHQPNLNDLTQLVSTITANFQHFISTIEDNLP